MKIFFVCKYNRFRSRVAESYFNLKNKTKKITASSGGVIVGRYPLNEREVKIAEEYGIKITGPPKEIRFEDLVRQDLIIVVANDVPRKIFNSKRFEKKVIVWSIPDVYPGDNKGILRSRIAEIKKRVDKLIKRLEKEK